MRRFGVICAHVVLPALLAVAVMTIGERIVGDTPVASAIAPTGYVWANRVFASKTALDGWLRARGSDFDTWAERHPAAARSAPPQVVTTRTSRNVALLTLAVGGFVAVSLAFALFLRYFRLAVVRPVLTPVLGRGGAAAVATTPPSSTRSERRPRRRKETAQPRERTPRHRPRVRAAARRAAPQTPRTTRLRFWILRMHRQHPDLGWYFVACSFAIAVGVSIPLLTR